MVGGQFATEEGQRGLRKGLRRFEDGDVFPVGDDPETGVGDGLEQVEGDGRREVGVPVAVDDQGGDVDRGELGRGDVHVVVIVPKVVEQGVKRPDLIVAEPVVLPEFVQEVRRQGLRRALAHDGTRGMGIVVGCADEDHRLQAGGLLKGRVEEEHPAAARADGVACVDVQVIEQGEEVLRRQTVGERAGGVVRASVAAEVGDDQTITFSKTGEERSPDRVGDVEPVEQDEGFPPAVKLVVHPEAVEGGGAGVARFHAKRCSPCS